MFTQSVLFFSISRRTDFVKTFVILPIIGAIVNTSDGRGEVIDVNLITGTLKVKMDRFPEAAPHTFKVKEAKLVKDGTIRLDKKEIQELKGLEDK